MIDALPTLTFDESALEASICRSSFEEFCKVFWEAIPGAGDLVWGWHMSYICEQLQIIAERVFRNEPKEYDLLINISPGTSKSSLCSILFPAWTWTRMPHARHITASHTDTLVLDLATKARHVIESEKYRRYFPEIVLRRDQSTKGYYANTLGGDRVSCTVGGKSPIGFHGHFLSFDDPIDPQKVLSEVELANAADFAPNVLFTRKVNKEVSVFFGIMQRLHPMDPTGALLKWAKEKEGSSPIKHICLPAELTDDVCPVELRGKYIDGLMDPIRLSHKALKPYKVNVYAYSGQFLQAPIPAGAGMFKPQYFNQRIKAAPLNCVRVRGWDRASTQDGGCYTAGVLMARDEEGIYYVEHVVHGQWEPTERNARMRACALRDRAKYGPRFEPTILVEAEGGSSGRDAWQGVCRALAGFAVKEIKVTGAKDTRAEPWSTQCAAGMVRVIEDGTWDISGYVEEHCLFRPMPGKRLGAMKDQVDSSSLCFNYLANMRTGPTLRSFSIRPRGKYTGIRIVVCSREELAETVIHDNSCLLIVFNSPLPVGNSEQPVHALAKLLDTHITTFADIQPIDYQDKWESVVEPYNVTPDQLIMTPDHGKKLWAFILRRRDPQPEVLVLCDEGDRRALSLAYAVCDIMRLNRNQAIHVVADPDDNSSSHEKREASNQHVYVMAKSCRTMVVG